MPINFEMKETVCDDGLDTNCDGLVDCEDASCSDFIGCEGDTPNEEVSCETIENCLVNEDCIDGFCVPLEDNFVCEFDVDCEINEICESGECIIDEASSSGDTFSGSSSGSGSISRDVTGRVQEEEYYDEFEEQTPSGQGIGLIMWIVIIVVLLGLGIGGIWFYMFKFKKYDKEDIISWIEFSKEIMGKGSSLEDVQKKLNESNLPEDFIKIVMEKLE